MSGTTYTCEECEETFEADWSDDEAQAEARELFPGVHQEDMAVVCEDCRLRIMERVEGVS